MEKSKKALHRKGRDGAAGMKEREMRAQFRIFLLVVLLAMVIIATLSVKLNAARGEISLYREIHQALNLEVERKDGGWLAVLTLPDARYEWGRGKVKFR